LHEKNGKANFMAHMVIIAAHQIIHPHKAWLNLAKKSAATTTSVLPNLHN